jgi:hypothetical protein
VVGGVVGARDKIEWGGGGVSRIGSRQFIEDVFGSDFQTLKQMVGVLQKTSFVVDFEYAEKVKAARGYQGVLRVILKKFLPLRCDHKVQALIETDPNSVAIPTWRL